jgi:hypothetical protein
MAAISTDSQGRRRPVDRRGHHGGDAHGAEGGGQATQLGPDDGGAQHLRQQAVEAVDHDALGVRLGDRRLDPRQQGAQIEIAREHYILGRIGHAIDEGEPAVGAPRGDIEPEFQRRHLERRGRLVEGDEHTAARIRQGRPQHLQAEARLATAPIAQHQGQASAWQPAPGQRVEAGDARAQLGAGDGHGLRASRGSRSSARRTASPSPGSPITRRAGGG